jgi:hypothetical protein
MEPKVTWPAGPVETRTRELKTTEELPVVVHVLDCSAGYAFNLRDEKMLDPGHVEYRRSSM